MSQSPAQPASNSAPAVALPYPVSVTHRDVFNEPRPRDGGVEVFDTPAALAINAARMNHLGSLGLPIEGRRVLDVGCGVGHLAQFFAKQRCRVVCIDGRKENLDSLHTRYPHTQGRLVDVETQPFTGLGRFDIVFCYGLLYHVSNPTLVLARMVEVCDDLLFLETIICDHREPIVLFADETRSANQAVAVLGCRPSPSYITLALDRLGMPYVYAPRTSPAFEDFSFPFRNNLEWRYDGHNIRCTFVASRRPIENPDLVNLVKKSPAASFAAPAIPEAKTLLEQPWAKLSRTLEDYAWLRPLTPYPGWFFSADYENKEPYARLRRRLWDHFSSKPSREPIVTPWYFGTSFRLFMGNDLSLPLYVGCCYDPNEFAFLHRLVKPGMTAIDAGANEGLYTLFLSKLVGANGRVIAFEPSQREYERLQANLSMNDLSNVTAWRTGLYDRSATTQLTVAVDKHAGQNTLGEFMYQGVAVAGRETIELARLDDWVAAHGVTKVDFVKLDIEGAEVAALRGAEQTLRRDKPALLLEVAPDALAKQGASRAALVELLKSLGYTLYTFDAATGWPTPAKNAEIEGNVVAIHASATPPENPHA